MKNILEKTFDTPRYKGHGTIILPEGKTLEQMRDKFDTVLSVICTKKAIEELSRK